MLKNKIVLLVAAVLGLSGLGYALYTNANAEAPAEQATSAAEGKGAAVASLAPTDMKGDAWLVRCNDKKPEEVSEKRGKCEIFQSQSIKESGQRLVEFAIGFPAESQDARGIIVLPLGIMLQDDISMNLDGGAAFNFKVRYCLANGCYAFMSMNEDLIGKMKNANKITVGIQSADGKKINLELPLSGFSKAIDQVS